MGHRMLKQRIIIFLTLALILSGCASNSALNKSAEYNEKSAVYYESIGQPDAARREWKMAQEKRNDALRLEAILFHLLFDSDENN